jgi:hypothetical protein
MGGCWPEPSGWDRRNERRIRSQQGLEVQWDAISLNTGAVLQEGCMGSRFRLAGVWIPNEGVRGSGRDHRRRSHRRGLRLHKAQIETIVVHLLRIQV